MWELDLGKVVLVAEREDHLGARIRRLIRRALKKALKSVVFAVVGLLPLLLGATPAFATCPPNGAPGLNVYPPASNPRYTPDFPTTYQSGGAVGTPGVQAVNANILIVDPWVDPPAGPIPGSSGSPMQNGAYNFSTAWVMLQVGGDAYHYEQIGWMKYNGSSPFIFDETGNGAGFYLRKFFGYASPGQTEPFMVQDNVNVGILDFFYGGNLVDRTSSFISPNQVTIAGEMLSKSNEFPSWHGGEQFSGAQYYSGGAWNDVWFSQYWEGPNAQAWIGNGANDYAGHMWTWDAYCSY